MGSIVHPCHHNQDNAGRELFDELAGKCRPALRSLSSIFDGSKIAHLNNLAVFDYHVADRTSEVSRLVFVGVGRTGFVQAAFTDVGQIVDGLLLNPLYLFFEVPLQTSQKPRCSYLQRGFRLNLYGICTAASKYEA